MAEHQRVEVIGLEAPLLISEILDCTDPDVQQEVVDFYQRELDPLMICLNEAQSDPPTETRIPQGPWLAAPGRTVVGARLESGELVGCWVVKDNGLWYPCIRLSLVVAGIRALWDETTQHFDYLWGSTDNPLIMAWAQQAKAPDSPTVIEEHRMVWRRPS
jgi:hypothetical protein